MITDLQRQTLAALDGFIQKSGVGPRLGQLHVLMGGKPGEHPTKWSSVLRLLRKAGAIAWTMGDYESISITPKGRRLLDGDAEIIPPAPDSDANLDDDDEDTGVLPDDDEEEDEPISEMPPARRPNRPEFVSRPRPTPAETPAAKRKGDPKPVSRVEPTLASLPVIAPANPQSAPTLLRPPVHILAVGARAALRDLDELEAKLAKQIDAVRTTRSLLTGA